MTLRHFNVSVSMYRELSPLHHGRGHYEQEGVSALLGLQRRQPPHWPCQSSCTQTDCPAGMPVEGLRSKSWDEFGKPDAPEIHFVFTVCDRDVDEPCPVWPVKPMNAQWSVRDPAVVTGTDEQIQSAYFEAFTEFLIEGSLCFFPCRWQHLKRKLSSGRSTRLAGAKQSKQTYLRLRWNRPHHQTSVLKRTLNVLAWVLIGLLLVATVWAVLWARKQPSRTFDLGRSI